jgi:hypothetical protein
LLDKALAQFKSGDPACILSREIVLSFFVESLAGKGGMAAPSYFIIQGTGEMSNNQGRESCACLDAYFETLPETEPLEKEKMFAILYSGLKASMDL